jgi:hypothetical protein
MVDLSIVMLVYQRVYGYIMGVSKLASTGINLAILGMFLNLDPCSSHVYIEVSATKKSRSMS